MPVCLSQRQHVWPSFRGVVSTSCLHCLRFCLPIDCRLFSSVTLTECPEGTSSAEHRAGGWSRAEHQDSCAPMWKSTTRKLTPFQMAAPFTATCNTASASWGRTDRAQARDCVRRPKCLQTRPIPRLRAGWPWRKRWQAGRERGTPDSLGPKLGGAGTHCTCRP